MNAKKINNNFEPYKRVVKFVGSAIIVLLELAAYYYVWMDCYNRNMTVAFWRRGNWLIAGEYLILSLVLHRLYGGLKVGIYKYWTLVYSHMLSIVGVNAFSYVQVVLFDKKMHNPAALLGLTALDFVMVLLWALAFKKIYAAMFPKRRLLLIYGKKPMFHLVNRIDTRDDKYEIAENISIDTGLERIIKQAEDYDGVIIGDIPARARNQLMKLCYARNIRSYTVPKISDILLRTSVELNIFDSPLYLSRNDGGLAWDQAVVKRIEDIIVAGAMLLVTSPFFLIIAFLIWNTDKGPIFYTQERLTKDGKIFRIYKFRTMIVDAEKKSGPVKAGEKDPRILPVGRFLRATRMDELPQLLNILKGDMSLVGPRPERPFFVEKFKEEIPRYMIKHQVRPGLTGWAQGNGYRGDTSIIKRIEHDLYYIENWTLGLDFKIMFLTVFKGFINKNAY